VCMGGEIPIPPFSDGLECY